MWPLSPVPNPSCVYDCACCVRPDMYVMLYVAMVYVAMEGTVGAIHGCSYWRAAVLLCLACDTMVPSVLDVPCTNPNVRLCMCTMCVAHR
jgi:hypothetical protein